MLKVIDESKMCPFAEQYDADLHDFVSNLRRVDGSIAVHPQYGPPVNIFSPKGTRKYWVRASAVGAEDGSVHLFSGSDRHEHAFWVTE